MKVRECRICGDDVPGAIALLREHLESHQANADGLSAEEVLDMFEPAVDDGGPSHDDRDAKVKAYLENSSRCPHCGSANIEAGSLDTCSGGEIYQPVGCLNCKKSWQDVYTLTDIEFNEDPGPA